MAAIRILQRGIRQALRRQIKSFINEIQQQGHVDTGRLIASLEEQLETLSSANLVGKVLAEVYGEYVSEGVAGSSVKYSFSHLQDWIRRKKPSASLQEQKSFFYAMKTVHQRQGIPSRGSFAYSKNGARKKWVDRGVKTGEKVFDQIIETAVGQYLDQFLSDTLTKFEA